MAATARSFPIDLDNPLPTPTRTPTTQPPSNGNINVASPVTPSVPPPDQQIRNSCIKKLNEEQALSPQNLDFILYLINNELQGDLKIMHSSFMDLNVTGIPHKKPDHFIAPICHAEFEGRWSLVLVGKVIEESANKVSFVALHYDAQPNHKRDTDVNKKLLRWVQGYYGKVAKLKFQLATGPKHHQEFASGPFVIMAAIQFAKFGMISSRNSRKWEDDPVALITGLLNSRRTAPHQQPSPSNVYGSPYKDPAELRRPESAPSTTSPRRRSNSKIPPAKTDMFSRPSPAPEPSKTPERSQTPEPSRGRRGRTSTPSERSNRGRSRTPYNPATMAMAGAIKPTVSSPKLHPAEACEPNSKEYRLENNKRSEHTMSIDEEERLESVRLRNERHELIAKFREMQKKVKDAQKSSSEAEQKYKEKITERDNATKEHMLAQDKVEDQQKERSKLIADLRPVRPSKYLGNEEMVEHIASFFDNKNLVPSKRDLEDKLKRKRKADDEIDSAQKVQKQKEVGIIEAQNAECEAEGKAQEACKRADVAVIFFRKKREYENDLEKNESHWVERKKKKDWLADWQEERKKQGRGI